MWLECVDRGQHPVRIILLGPCLVCLDESVGPQSCCRSLAISTNYRHNEQIRISPVRVVNDQEEQLGVLPTAEAIRMAREQGMDLVEVAPNARPPVCRIMDYGKWRYLQQKKEDRSRANAKGGQLKELKFRTVRNLSSLSWPPLALARERSSFFCWRYRHLP